MSTLVQRVDIGSVAVTFLPLPKGKKRGSAVGFSGSEPVAAISGARSSSPPLWWVNGRPEPITFQTIKNLNVRGASPTQIAGFWNTPKGEERAVVWTRVAGDSLAGVELHPPKWEKSAALSCGDGQQIGFGYEKFVKNPSRALLWTGSPDSLVVLSGPDPARDAMGNGVARGIQVGCFGGSGRQHACLWRGTTESCLDLHPTGADLLGSEVLGTDGAQHVGHVWTGEAMSRAALWSATPDSYVSLAPVGFAQSRARRCAHGLQVGWVSEKERGMLLRAVLWNGAAHDYLDLQKFLPEPWNASQALDLYVDDRRLRILGNAQQAVKSGGYEMDAGQVPVIWDFALSIAAPMPRRDPPAVVTATPVRAEPSAEHEIEHAGSELGRAMVAQDFKAAHALLAPWLQKQITAKQLAALVKKQLIDDVTPAGFEVGGNDSALDELRAHYAEYYANDRTRTLASTDDFGEMGPPSLYIDDEVTAANFRQWMSLELTPDEDAGSGLDFCLRLWLIVVEVAGEMRIGHLEPGE